jgi:DNA-binding transcriptional LysR family regulator
MARSRWAQRDVEIHQIRYFLAIVREGTFGRAAAACNVSQPSVTRAIHKLERELGGQVIDRSRASLTLTRLGEEMLPRLQGIDRQFGELRGEARRLNTDQRLRLRLGLLSSANSRGISALITRLLGSQTDNEVVVQSGSASDLTEYLLGGDLDAAISTAAVATGRIDFRPLYNEPFCIACAPGHRLAALDEVPLGEAAREPYAELSGAGLEDVWDSLTGPAARLVPQVSTDRLDLVSNLIRDGRWIGILPQCLQTNKDIAFRPLAAPAVSRSIGLLTVRGRAMTACVERLVGVAGDVDWG